MILFKMAGRTEREFPRPRCGSVMFVYDHQLFLWGGMTQIMLGEGDDRFLVDIDLPDIEKEELTEGPVLEILDLSTHEWREQVTYGDIPEMGKGSFHAVKGEKLYLFGGSNDAGFCKGLYQLDLNTYKWDDLSRYSKSPALSLGGAVVCGTSLLFFGGVGQELKGAKGSYQPCSNLGYSFDYGWNNYLQEYDTVTKHWAEISCDGEKPPPSSRFTLNKIDPSHALLFGGKQEKYTVTYNHVFIYDMDNKKWNKVETKPDKWPCARGLHAASVLVDPSSEISFKKQYVLLVWGQGSDARHVHDAWILHVQSMTWRQFLLPVDLKSRMYHMSCSYHIQDSQTDVIIFGGNKRRESKYHRNVITSPIVIRFGSVQPLHELCLAHLKKIEGLQSSAMFTSLPPSLQKILTKTEESQDLTIIYPLGIHFK